MFALQLTESRHIHATPWHIWKIVSGFSGYANWNPLLPKVRGKAQESAALAFKARCLTRAPLPFHGRVTRAIAYQGLALRGSLFTPYTPFVLDLLLAMFIDPMDRVSCTCTMGLKARGLLVPIARPVLTSRLETGFVHMNDLVKILAEGGQPNA